jgi:hypothetical protein
MGTITLRLLLVALSVALFFAATSISSGAEETASVAQPPEATESVPEAPKPLRNNCGRLFTQAQFKKYAGKVYYRTKITKRAGARMKQMVRCQHSPKAERKMRKLRRELKAARTQRARQARIATSLTPYNCGSMGRFAIPCYIIACESGGSWSAYNPSGARGPYQFLGWNVPWPVRSEADKIAHHRMGARLWAGGSGASHWVCA